MIALSLDHQYLVALANKQLRQNHKCELYKFFPFLFCSILFYSILFYSILFYSILFYSILFYSILFCSTLFFLFSSLLLCVLIYSVPFFCFILFHSALLTHFHSSPFAFSMLGTNNILCFSSKLALLTLTPCYYRTLHTRRTLYSSSTVPSPVHQSKQHPNSLHFLFPSLCTVCSFLPFLRAERNLIQITWKLSLVVVVY